MDSVIPRVFSNLNDSVNSDRKIRDVMSKSDYSLPHAKFGLEVSQQISDQILLFNYAELKGAKPCHVQPPAW